MIIVKKIVMFGDIRVMLSKRRVRRGMRRPRMRMKKVMLSGE